MGDTGSPAQQSLLDQAQKLGEQRDQMIARNDPRLTGIIEGLETLINQLVARALGLSGHGAPPPPPEPPAPPPPPPPPPPPSEPPGYGTYCTDCDTRIYMALHNYSSKYRCPKCTCRNQYHLCRGCNSVLTVPQLLLPVTPYNCYACGAQQGSYQAIQHGMMFAMHGQALPTVNAPTRPLAEWT